MRWDPDRDAELVSLVNMQSEDTGVAAMKIPAAQIVVTEYYRRKLLRLNSVPQQSLQRRFILLKLFNRHLHQAIVLVDFSHRNVQLSIAATICELQVICSLVVVCDRIADFSLRPAVSDLLSDKGFFPQPRARLDCLPV